MSNKLTRQGTTSLELYRRNKALHERLSSQLQGFSQAEVLRGSLSFCDITLPLDFNLNCAPVWLDELVVQKQVAAVVVGVVVAL